MTVPGWLYDLIRGPAWVRMSLDPTLSADDLSDDVINSAMYAEAAIAEVMARDPLLATRTDPDQQTSLSRATVLITAALLAPQMPVVVREADDTGYQIARQPVDLLRLAAELRARAETAIASVVDTGDLTAYRPTLFGVASGARGF